MYVKAENSPKKIFAQNNWSVLGKLVKFICVPTALDNDGTNAWLEKNI